MIKYGSAKVGEICKRFRIEKTNATQSDIARELCYVKSNISAFECGRNNNADILLWYIMHGLDIRRELSNAQNV